ncbi:MAG: VWA domain-containing protein [Chloroflexota bacterium]|nr:VWA domain-containing protein [Chloroflexota bacterium]
MLRDEVRQLRGYYEASGHGHLFHNLLLFARILREMGLDANPTRTIDLLRSVEFIGLSSKEDFYAAGKAIMLRRADEEPLYDYVFQMFWRRWPSREEDGNPFHEVPQTYPLAGQENSKKEMPKPPTNQNQREPANQSQQALDLATMGKRLAEGETKAGDNSKVEKQETYSALETLQTKDFQDFSPDELTEAKRLMLALRWSLSLRPSRRMAAARHGRRFDARRTVRKSLKYGGIPIELYKKERKQKPRPLVLICDVSGSMDLYSRLLLQFMHSMENGLKFVETFVFGTRLTRITHELKNKNIDEALFNVSKLVKDWSGGTKIGESLENFNLKWARRVLGHGAVVIIISDGWDRGSVETLRREMARLQRMSFRLIWLNPLLGLTDYQPLTVGIQAALEYVDDFLPAHSFRSLENLGLLLADLNECNRPSRRQHSAIK